jgi:putative transposase
MIDGIGFGDHTAIVALGITSEGRKVVLGLRIGSTENARVGHDLLTDLIDRGLNYQGGLLAIIDGAKALRKALKDVFGSKVLIQRCQVHKLRNVLGYLPMYKRAHVKHKLQRAWASGSAAAAVRQLRSLATSLEADYPDAAASLREGLKETATIL